MLNTDLSPKTTLRFHHSDRLRTTPPSHSGQSTEIGGQDDEITGQPYYAVEVAVSIPEFERLDSRTLIPDMPAEVFVRTAARTPLSYLVKPLSDHLRCALREV